MPIKRETSAVQLSQVSQIIGNQYYVCATAGSDLNSGFDPKSPLATIGAAIAAVSVGDIISVACGDYTEVGLDLDVNSVKLICSPGTTFSPATGNVLVVSGDDCKITGHIVIYAAADTIGLQLTGDRLQADDIVVIGTACATGAQVTGDLCDLTDIKCAGVKAGGKAFDVSGGKTTLRNCGTVGSAASYGFYLSGEIGLLERCFSSGHTVSGFYVASGGSGYNTKDCSSGAGDGPRVDVDGASVWSKYTFADEVFHLTTFDGTGSSDNLFKVSGAVEISSIYGDVDTILNADVGNVKLEIYDGTTAVDLTTVVASSSADVGSLFIKTEPAANALTLAESDQGRLVENTSFRRPRLSFIINQKKDTDTFIRVNYSGTATDGAIHWHCKYAPLTEDGFVEAV